MVAASQPEDREPRSEEDATPSPSRSPVRLGTHGEDYIFERAAGLRTGAVGIAVVGTGRDPELLFEEHALGAQCQYFEVLSDATELDENLGPTDGRPEIAERLTSDHWPTKFHALQAAFALETPGNVNAVLRTLRAELTPHGGVYIVRTDRRLHLRKAMIRVQHAAQAQADRPIDALLGDPQPLEEHSAGHDGTYHYLYTPMVLLASPFVRGFTACRVVSEASESYALVVLHAPGRSAPIDPDEITWRDVLSSGLPALRDPASADTSWLQEVNAPAADLDPGTLIQWWTTQLNALFTEATDLGRYRDVDGVLDARGAYRALRTLDRIIANCVRIQADANDHVDRVAAAFEFVDLLPSLSTSSLAAGRAWTTLMHPGNALKLLRRAFADAPADVRDVLIVRAERVTAKLKEETLAAVVPGRRRGGAVQVGHRRKPIVGDVFVAKLLHQLRNTHHGYELEEEAQRDILDAHTGHISAAFPELVVLYVLAVVASPASALSGDWFL